MVYLLQYKSLSITNYLMLAVFILCIAVQYNDPDSGIWMLIYSSAAIVCFLASRNKMHWTLPASICLIVFSWGLILANQVPESFSFNEKLSVGIGASISSFIFFFFLGYMSKYLSNYLKADKIWKIINLLIIIFMFFIVFYVLVNVINFFKSY